MASAKLESNEPFCLARFPDEDELKLYLNPTKTNSKRKDLFLVKGWCKNDTTYYYAAANSEKQNLSTIQKAKYSDTIQEETTYQNYVAYFEKYQHAFANTNLKKAILSRLKFVKTPNNFDCLKYFARLEFVHSTALVYILLHPTKGLWIGATPEILISQKENKYTTVSLAGTQTLSEAPYEWSDKAKEEQEYVSAHIRESLSTNGIEKFTFSGPSTTVAGSVAHLKTSFEFEQNDKVFDILNIASELHPTPAVSGTPVKDSIEFINATENHDRQLYTGYLGRISAQSGDVFVNLRCMQVLPEKLILYVGGGITQASRLQEEWDETEQKAKTLLNQIKG